MHRIDSATAEADKFGAGKDGFTEGTPGVTAATETTDDWFDGVQEEICNVIEGNGGTLVKGTRTQLRDIIRNLVGAAGGPGVKATGGSGNANGGEFIGTGTLAGAKGTASGESNSSVGLEGNGDVSGAATTSDGVHGTGAGTDGHGLVGTGAGTGPGVKGIGANGPAVEAIGDTTSPLAPSLIIGAQDAVPSSITTEGGVSIVNTAMRLADGSAYRKVSVLRGTQTATDEITATTADFATQVTLPSNMLKAGDVVKVRVTVRSKTGTASGSNTVLSIFCGGITMTAESRSGIATGDAWHFDCSMTVWTAGGPGTGTVRGVRMFDPASGTTAVSVTANIAATPDTTAANVVKVNATAPAGDTLELCEFAVEV